MERKDLDDFNQDPRNAFINFLIKNMFIVEEHLFLGGRFGSAIRALTGLIASLDKDSKEKLKPQYEELRAFEQNILTCTREKMYQIYYDVLSQLQATYLVEFRRQRLEKQDYDKLDEEEKSEEP